MISISRIIQYNQKILRKTDTILNKTMIESSLSSYFYYDDIQDQVSSVVRGLAKNHGFVDGNKRTAFAVLHYLSSEFNLKLKDNKELVPNIVNIAEHNYDVPKISTLLFQGE